MTTPLKFASIAIALTGAVIMAAPAEAQVYRGHGYGHYDRTPSYADQFDRPGDFRCDAYWDRGRSDCHEGWRDQRPYYRSGYGYRAPYYGQYAHGGAAPYYGAYGRPDLVYPGAGHGAYGAPVAPGARDPQRMDWCRWTYRSYDPQSGYYRAYSGRYVYCG